MEKEYVEIYRGNNVKEMEEDEGNEWGLIELYPPDMRLCFMIVKWKV